MPITDSFRDEKNKQSNKPVLLFSMQVTDMVTEYFTEYPINVQYPTGTGPTYTAIPIKVKSIPAAAFGESDSILVTLSNVTSDIANIIHRNNGFEGRAVNIKLVWENLLDDDDAYQEDIFMVDAWKVPGDEAEFILRPFLFKKITLPKRRIQKICNQPYKSEGCWHGSWDAGWHAPAGFVDTGSCDRSYDGPNGCLAHANGVRFGGVFILRDEIVPRY